MFHRFNKNSDGKIDQQELTLARQAAEIAVDNNHGHDYTLAASYIVDQKMTIDLLLFLVSQLKNYSNGILFR